MAIWSIIRAEGIPFWVTLLAVFSTVISFYFGITAILDPTSAFGMHLGADDHDIARYWAARNLGLAVVMLAAVLLRRAEGYVVAYAGALVRDFGDLIIPYTLGHTPETALPLAILFQFLNIVPFSVAIWAVVKSHRR